MNKTVAEIMNSGGPSPLTSILRGIRVSESFYSESTLTAPWGFRSPTYPIALFHFVLRGSCWFCRDGQPSVQVAEGSMVLVPHGKTHRLSSTPDGPVVDVETIPRTQLGENVSRMSLGGGGDETFMICGGMHLEPTWHPLLVALPQVFIVDRTDERAATWLQPILALLSAEAGTGRTGGEVVITRLIEVLVLATIREWFETEHVPSSGWLAAARHQQIGRALGEFHRNPQRPWSVAELARTAGMSRSVFAQQFSEICGVPPGQYTTHCRMNIAGHLLKQTSESLQEVADRMGYSSEATFSRAFKRSWGISPGRFRRHPMGTRRSFADWA